MIIPTGDKTPTKTKIGIAKKLTHCKWLSELQFTPKSSIRYYSGLNWSEIFIHSIILVAEPTTSK